MKFLILASIVVVCAMAEPEAEPEGQYYGFGGQFGSYYRRPYSGAYGKTYNGYGVWPYSYTPGFYNQRYAMTTPYNTYNRIYKREAEAEAEPEAEADAQFYYRPGVYTSRVNTPFTSGVYGPYHQRQYSTYGTPAVYTTPYTSYNTPYTGFNTYPTTAYHRLFKREAEAEAEPEADADAQFYYRPGVYTTRVNTPFTSGVYGPYQRQYSTYGTPSVYGYQHFQKMPYNYHYMNNRFF